MANELNETPSVSALLEAENEAVEGGSSQPLQGGMSVEPETTVAPAGPAVTRYDPARRAGDPFDYSRNLRLQAATLFPDDETMQSEYVARGNKQLASEALRLDKLLFDPKKGFLTKGPVDYSWKLASLAREEAQARKDFDEVHGRKMQAIATHHANIAGLERENIGLQLKSLQHKQDYHDTMAISLDNQLFEAGKIKEKYQPLEDKFMVLMDRIYTGMDHSLEGGGLYDMTDTTTEFDAESNQWVTREETSWGGVAAVAASALGIAANFTLTVASEGKVPMVMDRLIFGIADRSLAQQKAKIEKYRSAGRAVNTLYGTLLGSLESERAADNAFYAAMYKRIGHEFEKKAAVVESDVARNSWLAKQEQMMIAQEEYELKAKEALLSWAQTSRQKEREAYSQFQQTQSVFRSTEAHRLQMLADRVRPPAEIAAERGLEWKSEKMTTQEDDKLKNLRVQANYLSKAMVLIERLEEKYGPDNTLAGNAINRVRKMINIKKSELGHELTDEYALNELGILAAQKHGKDSDTGNQAVEELKFWIERFFTGEESMSVVKFKVAEFFEQTIANAASDYQKYKILGNTAKANVWANELMMATKGAWDSADDVAREATDPETSAQIWNTYYILHSQKDSGYWDRFKHRLDQELRVGMGEAE